MSPEHELTENMTVIYAATFPAGNVVLEINNVPMHALSERDTLLLDELIAAVKSLGRVREDEER